MQALQDANAYGGGPLLAVQQELLGKQMQSFEALMASLRDRMCAYRPLLELVYMLPPLPSVRLAICNTFPVRIMLQHCYAAVCRSILFRLAGIWLDGILHDVFRSAEFDKVAGKVSKLAADGARVLKEQRVALDSRTAQQQIGAAPSLADCVLGLQNLRCALFPDILLRYCVIFGLQHHELALLPFDLRRMLCSRRQMLADECRLHAALCAELTTEAVDEDLQAVQQLWAGVHLTALSNLAVSTYLQGWSADTLKMSTSLLQISPTCCGRTGRIFG